MFLSLTNIIDADVDVWPGKLAYGALDDDAAVKGAVCFSTWPSRRDPRKAKEDSGVVPFGVVVNQTRCLIPF